MKNIKAIVFQICREFGWKIEYVESLCINTVFVDIAEEFLKYPPLHVIVPAYVGYDSKKTASKITSANDDTEPYFIRSAEEIPPEIKDQFMTANKNQKVDIDPEVLRMLELQESGIKGKIDVKVR